MALRLLGVPPPVVGAAAYIPAHPLLAPDAPGGALREASCEQLVVPRGILLDAEAEAAADAHVGCPAARLHCAEPAPLNVCAPLWLEGLAVSTGNRETYGKYGALLGCCVSNCMGAGVACNSGATLRMRGCHVVFNNADVCGGCAEDAAALADANVFAENWPVPGTIDVFNFPPDRAVYAMGNPRITPATELAPGARASRRRCRRRTEMSASRPPRSQTCRTWRCSLRDACPLPAMSRGQMRLTRTQLACTRHEQQQTLVRVAARGGIRARGRRVVAQRKQD
jgi:hypothetical protein